MRAQLAQCMPKEAPEAELFGLCNRAKSQARGSFEMEFSKYEEVPATLRRKIVEAHKQETEGK